MKILHVLWGFSPWREGGLVLYAEELMRVQSAAGHTVAAFFAGRRRFWGKPRLAQWSRGIIAQFEVQNAPLVHLGKRGTFPAEAELQEPVSEEYFKKALTTFVPDVVHIHELAGLPFSLIDICKERNLPLILTLHDYFPLCPTLNLFDPEGEYCRDISGEGCVICCRKGSDGGLYDRVRTLRSGGKPLWLYAIPLMLRYVWDLLQQAAPPPGDTLIAGYRRRHEENRIRLQQADIIISQSHRTKEIYEERTGRKDIRVIHSSLSHIEKILPERKASIASPVRFATLNGAIGPYKGSMVIRDCVELLKQRGYDGAYRLDIFGGMQFGVRRSLLSSASVRWRGTYHHSDLNMLLREVDCGIIPSLWEEVYGYVGIEFLAKGIPVIGNRRGGITDYTANNQTGWINESCSADELADIMEGIIKNPASILPLNHWIVDHRNEVLPDRDQHFCSVSKCYEQAIAMHEGIK